MTVPTPILPIIVTAVGGQAARMRQCADRADEPNERYDGECTHPMPLMHKNQDRLKTSIDANRLAERLNQNGGNYLAMVTTTGQWSE